MEENNNNNSISKYSEGSIKELWSISFPLMISSLATLMMIFVDRCFLSHYSLDSLNASVNAGTLAWAYLGGSAMIAATSAVFVSQYNGANKLEHIGRPVWQMIWFCLFSIVLFIPLGFWIGPFIFKNSPFYELECQYFLILMLMAPFFPLVNGLSGFYIGRGKTKFLIYLAILANLINIFLDWILIFGWSPIIPELGIKGAAIATSCGSIFQAIVLLYMFLRPSNRKRFGTNVWGYSYKIFFKCLKVGMPQGIFYSIEILGWVLFFKMMTAMGSEYITISSICQSLIILLSFFADGLSKGVTAVAGNFIGSMKMNFIKNVFRSGIKLQMIFSVFLAIFLIANPNAIINALLPKETLEISSHLNIDIALLYKSLQLCFICVFGYLFFQGIRWIFAGLLTAAGDTLFLLISGSLSIWAFFLLPVYIIVIHFFTNIIFAWSLSVFYSIVLSAIYYIRYKRGKWRNIQLINQDQEEEDAVTK